MLCVAVFCLIFAACNTTEPATAPEGLDDDIHSLMFSLNGVLYTLPLSLAELEANGWEEGEAMADIMLYPHQHRASQRIAKDDREMILVTFFNPTEYVIPLREGMIVLVEVSSLWRTPAPLIVPGNIRLGSTYEEVIIAHGEPSERVMLGTRESLLYYMDDVFANIVINRETDRVTALLLQLLT